MLAIRQLRKELGLKQIDIAKNPNINTTPATVSRWETGKQNPPMEKIPILAKILNCSIDELFNYNK